MDDLTSILADISDETTHAFDAGITHFVNHAMKADDERRLEEILGSSQDERLRYTAFYALILHYRNQKNRAKIEEAFYRYRDAFGAHPTFRHLELVCGLKLEIWNDPRKMIQDSLALRDKYPDNAGIVHLFADIVVTLYEKALVPQNSEMLRKAFEAVESAISLDVEYPKYYATRARIQLLMGNLEDALTDIETALRIESPQRIDYVQKISDYSYCRYKILMRMEQKAFDARHEQIEKKVDGATLKNLEVLGLFTAVISFTIGSLELARGQSAQDAIKLIACLMIGLLLVYSCFGLMLHSLNRNRTVLNIILAVLAAAAMLGVLLFV